MEGRAAWPLGFGTIISAPMEKWQPKRPVDIPPARKILLPRPQWEQHRGNPR